MMTAFVLAMLLGAAFAMVRINWVMNVTFRILDKIAIANAVEVQQEIYDWWRLRYAILDTAGSLYVIFWKFWVWTPAQIYGRHKFTHGDWLTPQIPSKDLN